MTAPDWLTTYDDLTPHWEAGVLTLHRPLTGAWRIEQVEQVNRLLEQLAGDLDTRVVVFDLNSASTGELDAEHWQQAMTTEPARTRRALQSLHRWRTHQMKVLPQAVLSRVEGRCCGVDLILIEGSDVALACENSVFEVDDTLVSFLGDHGEPGWRIATTPYPGPLDSLKMQCLNAQEAWSNHWVTLTGSPAEVCTWVQDLIQSWLSKDPLALQFTKETLAHAPNMSWDASVSYTAAKFAEIKARQAALGSSSRAQAIAGFLSGQSKPGLKG